jgi:hypothetical protein
MKLWNLLVLTAFLLAGNAQAYVTGAVNPETGEGEKEYRVAKKSETAGVSDAVSRGHILSLDSANNNDGYTVTRVGANNVVGAAQNVCVAPAAIATGNTGLVRCVSRGYVDFLRYDATTAISVGQKLCANASGVAVVCSACVAGSGTGTDCRFGTATSNSIIVSLEAKPSGTGTNLKAVILSR